MISNTRAPTANGSYLSAALASLALCAHAWPYRWTTVDDAWITARYALLLAHGHGAVYDPGEWIEGASSPLWTALLGAAIALGLDPGAVMVHAGLLCGMLLPPAAAWLALRLGAGTIGAATVPWAVALSPHVALASTNGLETSAWLLALVLAVGAVGHGGALAGAGIGLLAAVRPEGAVVAVALGAAHVLRGGDRRLVAGVAASLAAVLAVRFALYGALLPNPVAAKRDGTLADRLSANLDYVRLDGITWFGAAALAAAAPLLPGRRLDRAVPVGLAVLLLGGFLQVEEWMPAARLQLPLWILGAAAWAAADLPRGLSAVPALGALVVLLSPVRARAVRYDTVHSVLPDNPAAVAARTVAAELPPGSAMWTRDAGVLAFHVGPEVRVVELHPRALTRLHPDGADLRAPDGVPELLVTTVQREDAPRTRYASDLDVLERAEWRFLGRVRQHHHRYYDFWARPDVPLDPLPDDLRVR